MVGVVGYRKISEITGMSISHCRLVSVTYLKSLAKDKDAFQTKTRKALRLRNEQADKETKLDERHIQFLTSKETLKRWVGLSLEH